VIRRCAGLVKQTIQTLRSMAGFPSTRLMAIPVSDLQTWLASSEKKRSSSNLDRIRRHIIPFEGVRDAKIPKYEIDSCDMLVFMHIPKNGGTTLRHLISRNVSPTLVASVNEDALAHNPYMCWHLGRPLPCVLGHTTRRVSFTNSFQGQWCT